jgi:hypothetical protein
MLVRIETVVRLKIRKHETQLHTIQFGVVNDQVQAIVTIVSLFNNFLIPSDQICRVRPAFFNVDFGPGATRHLNRLTRLFAFSGRLRAAIARLQRPLWVSDFPAFLRALAQEAAARQVPDLCYFSPLEGEVGLSRCLFRAASAVRPRLDAAVGRFPALPPDAFGDALLRECYALLPARPALAPLEESLMLLLFFRCLFNRTYERFPSAFAPSGPAPDLAAIAALPARWFAYSRAMVGAADGGRSIGAVFRADPLLRAAGQFLETAIWAPNPLDGLFAVHKAIVAIQKGAFINRLRGGAGPDSEFLCFDDLFALLFGTLLGTAPDVPDIGWVAWLIGRFAPRDALSAPFDFAKATVEGLAAHCAAFDADAFAAEHREEETPGEG